MKKLFLLCLILLVWVGECWGAEYYIDPDWAGVENGTEAEPFNSWDDVSWIAGNTYLQKSGTTFNGQIQPTTSGTDGNIITITSYGTGSKPVVTNSSGHAISLNNRNYVTIDGLNINGVNNHAIYGQASINDFRYLTITNCDITVSGTADDKCGIYMYILTAGHLRNFEFSNNNITNSGTGSHNDGIRFLFGGTSTKTTYDGAIKNNNISNIVSGHALKWQPINQSAFYSNSEQPYGIDINGNIFENIYYTAISTGAGIKSVVDHPSYIRNNTAIDIGDVGNDSVNAFQLNWCSDVLIYKNNIGPVYNNPEEGDGSCLILDWLIEALATETKSSGNEVKYNIVYGAQNGAYSAGIDLWCAANNTIYCNVSYSNNSAIRISQQHSTSNLIYNNTLYDGVYGVRVDDPDNNELTDSTIINNAIVGFYHGIHLANNNPDSTESYNLFYNNTVDYYDIKIMGGHSLDSTDIIGSNDPFRNASGNNFSLTGGSPCIRAGTIITGTHDQATAATDITGRDILGRPSIGAYEYPDPDLYINADFTGSVQNGTKYYPYNALSDYAWSDYHIRTGMDIYLTGAFGLITFADMDNDPTTTIRTTGGKSTSIAGFIPFGSSTNVTLNLLEPHYSRRAR